MGVISKGGIRGAGGGGGGKKRPGRACQHCDWLIISLFIQENNMYI